jgi:hypothetical protein
VIARLDLRTLRVTAAVLLTCVGGCSRVARPVSVAAVPEVLPAVSQAVLESLLADSSLAMPVLVAELQHDATISADDVARAFANAGARTPADTLVAAFVVAQRDTHRVNVRAVGARWQRVSVATLDSLRAATRVARLPDETADRSSNAFWTAWARQYPRSGGYHQLSAMAVDVRRGEALALVSQRCGAVCGASWYVFLRRESADKWRVVTRVQRSVS